MQEVASFTCSELCNARLECKHTCTKRCHPEGGAHSLCIQKVEFVFASCGHRGSRRCSDNEGACKVPCGRAIDGCPKGHVCQNGYFSAPSARRIFMAWCLHMQSICYSVSLAFVLWVNAPWHAGAIMSLYLN